MGGGDCISLKEIEKETDDLLLSNNRMASLTLKVDIDMLRRPNEMARSLVWKSPTTYEAQNAGQLNPNQPQSATPFNEVKLPRAVFTKQQLIVLEAQILAYRRLKYGDGVLPQELLQFIAPPSLGSQVHPPSLDSQVHLCHLGSQVHMCHLCHPRKKC